MRKVLVALISATVIAAGLRVTPVDCASAADIPNVAKSLGEMASNGDKGLVGYWNFDEGKGETTKDRSQYGNDGKISGATWAKGVIGNALEFNGKNDYFNMRSPVSGSNKAVSVEAWVKPIGNNVNANLIVAGPESLDFGIWIQGGRLFAGFWNSEGTQNSAISSSIPTPDQWCHVAMTCDLDIGKVIRLYINGKLNCSNAATGTALKSGHTSIDVGGRTPHSWYFSGLIDEVKLYNRALSEEEIGNSYNEDMKKRAEEINTTGYKNSPWIGAANRDQRTTCFRKSFKVSDISGKKVYLICDGDQYQVFLNGKEIIPFKGYSEAQMVDISKELKTGENVIAAQATNMVSNIGFFTCIGYPSKEVQHASC